MENYLIMIALPTMYTPEQLMEIENYITDNFGSNETDYIAHEIESNYVHTDILIIDNPKDLKVITSIGMGARQMNVPNDSFQNIEIMGFASKKLKLKSKEELILANEIIRLTKLPFSNNTWFGPGHTVNASESFKKAFGYDYFLFAYSGFSHEVSNIGTIKFLTLIPLYENERNFIVENGDTEYLEKLLDEYGANMFILNEPRKSIFQI